MLYLRSIEIWMVKKYVLSFKGVFVVDNQRRLYKYPSPNRAFPGRVFLRGRVPMTAQGPTDIRGETATKFFYRALFLSQREYNILYAYFVYWRMETWRWVFFVLVSSSGENGARPLSFLHGNPPNTLQGHSPRAKRYLFSPSIPASVSSRGFGLSIEEMFLPSQDSQFFSRCFSFLQPPGGE